jgi:hypothetical protein
MADLLRRIFGPQAIASGISTLFTGTSLHTYTIKNIRIVNTDTVNAKTLILGIGGVAAANQILPQITIDAGGAAECDSLIVLVGAETLQANASGTGLTITASGLDQS